MAGYVLSHHYIWESRSGGESEQRCGWRHCEGKCVSDVLVQSVNIPAFLHRVYFGKGVLLIWMLAASCFH